jgi:glyoxylase-like metal-dependent hydrolase (beta-lactamase superfamily II)/rhodanese-related sulfurtransferase
MIFRQLFDKESSTYTYLIGDEATREAVLVDSVLPQFERDLKVLAELGLKLVHVLETHVHADHVTGAAKLRDVTGCTGVVPEHANVGCADRFVRDGDTLQIGAVTITAIATPGHTDSHVAYRVNDDRVLSGDALFIRGCGRTDFQNGDAGRLYDSVTRRLFTLPDDTLVYPGHDYRGLTVTTVGEEKRCNPRFVGRTREQFREFMAKLNLPMPQKIMEALPANEQCGRVTRAAPGAAASSAAQQTRPLTPAQLQAELGRAGTLIIDTREPAEFARAHIAGARSMPLDLLDPAQLPRDQQLVVVCELGLRSPDAAAQLAAAGCADVAHLEGGLTAWQEAGLPVVTDGAAPISIMRQVQIVAGSLIVLGAALGVLVSPWFLLLVGLVGAGLLLAGLLNSCLMTRLLAKLPYNRHSVA